NSQPPSAREVQCIRPDIAPGQYTPPSLREISCRPGAGRDPDPHSSLRRRPESRPTLVAPARPESRLTLVAPAKAGVQTHTRGSGEGQSPDSHSSPRRSTDATATHGH